MSEIHGESGVRRFVAHLIDTTIVMLLTIAGMWAVAMSTEQNILAIISGAVVFLSYYIVFEGNFSRTPGKMLLGLIVVTSDGYTIGWSQAFTRTLIRLIEVNPLVLGALPAGVAVLVSRRHQRLGDMAADTVVIRGNLSNEEID